MNITSFSMNVVIGPRVVGETMGLHLLIKELLEGGTDPHSILYLNLDLAADLESFGRLLHHYLEIGDRWTQELLHIPDSVKDWWEV